MARRNGSIVIAEHQGDIEHRAMARGYTALGVRLMCCPPPRRPESSEGGGRGTGRKHVPLPQ